MTTFRIADFFCGVGGISKGFHEANDRYITVFANDCDKYCAKTYENNSTIKVNIKNIYDLKVESIPDFDIFCGGFPCQPFSNAGKKKGFDDKRSQVFFDIIKILEIKKPICIFLENVKNLKTHDNGLTFKIIKEKLENIGYILYDKILNSCEYGNVPQNRERIYIVGFLDYDSEFVFPSKIPLSKNISDCLEEKVSDKLYYTEKDKIYNNIKNEITEKNNIYQYRRYYVRKNKSNVCPTLTANMGTGGHNIPIIKDDNGIRKLSARECFNFQGFDSTFKLPSDVSSAQLYKQVGNSVSVPVIKKIAEEIFKCLNI